MCPGGGATLASACHRLSVAFSSPGATTATWDCHRQQVLQWSNGAGDWYVPDASVDKVHIVYMTHLDVGFTNTSRNICDLYFNTFFPRPSRPPRRFGGGAGSSNTGGPSSRGSLRNTSTARSSARTPTAPRPK